LFVELSRPISVATTAPRQQARQQANAKNTAQNTNNTKNTKNTKNIEPSNTSNIWKPNSNATDTKKAALLLSSQRNTDNEESSANNQRDKNHDSSLKAKISSRLKNIMRGDRKKSNRSQHPDISEVNIKDNPPLPKPDNLPNQQPEKSLGDSGRDFHALFNYMQNADQRLIFIGAFDQNGDASALAQMLGASILESGQSVAIVDAGSTVISSQAGISDLAAGDVDFGEIVIHGEPGELSEVMWGTKSIISSRSENPAILVEALEDICDVVIVYVGGMGIKSGLPLFAGLNGTLALVSGSYPDKQMVRETLEDVDALGFKTVKILTLAKNRTNVA